jgi:hypothetical protein
MDSNRNRGVGKNFLKVMSKKIQTAPLYRESPDSRFRQDNKRTQEQGLFVYDKLLK